MCQKVKYLVASSGTYVSIEKSLISPIYKILGGECYSGDKTQICVVVEEKLFNV